MDRSLDIPGGGIGEVVLEGGGLGVGGLDGSGLEGGSGFSYVLVSISILFVRRWVFASRVLG